MFRERIKSYLRPSQHSRCNTTFLFLKTIIIIPTSVNNNSLKLILFVCYHNSLQFAMMTITQNLFSPTLSEVKDVKILK